VLIARFIPLVRSFISVAAGLAEMALGKFALFTVIGCAAWCAALASIGYSLGSSYEHVIKAFSYAGYVAIVLVVLAIVALLLHRLRVVRAERAGLEPRRRGAHSRR
jgi:membrane protein DedA with SNARE-associated domain